MFRNKRGGPPQNTGLWKNRRFLFAEIHVITYPDLLGKIAKLGGGIVDGKDHHVVGGTGESIISCAGRRSLQQIHELLDAKGVKSWEVEYVVKGTCETELDFRLLRASNAITRVS